MCIIAFKPEGVRLAESTMTNCFISNSDGAGFLVWDSENNKLICKKGFFSIKELVEAFEPFQNNRAVVHFRIGTHGRKDLNNCHPFLITENLGFVHNGVIGIRRDIPECSDTWHFNLYMQSYLADNPDAWETDRFQSHLLEIDHALCWSRLVFMDNLGNYLIYGEKEGIWDEGCWFSNHGYQDWCGYGNYYGMGGWRDVGSGNRSRRFAGSCATTSSATPAKPAIATEEHYDSNIMYPKVTCPRCDKDYQEFYKHWYDEIGDFICNECAKQLSETDPDKVMNYGGMASSIGSLDGITSIKLPELTPNKKEEQDVDCCDACGDVDRMYFYNGEHRVWLCEQCCAAWHQLTEDEKFNRLNPVN